MNKYVLIFTACIVIFMMIKNVQLYFKYKGNEEYVDCFNKLKVEGNEAYQDIMDYLAREKKPSSITKTLLLELFIELDKNDPKQKETIANIELSNIFCENNVFSKEKVARNADSIVWIIMCIARAKRCGHIDIANKLHDKIVVYEKDLSIFVEYQLCKAVYSATKHIEDKGIPFFNMLMNGEYGGMLYEKRFIGTYKRIAAATLFSLPSELSEYDRQDLNEFAKSYIGQEYMKDLGIYDYFKEEK